MGCDNPMIRVSSPRMLSVNGKPATVKILTSCSDEEINEYYHKFIDLFKDGNTYKHPVMYKGGEHYAELIPCGKCIGCRLEYSRQWAMRCTLEALQHDCNYFVTLTYDDSNLPKNPYRIIVDDNGEVTHEGRSNPLVADHLKKFIKDLRRYFSYHFNHDNIRFFACGEYGGRSGRAHFHVILFNCPIPDLKFWKRNFQDKPLYNSKILDSIWKKGYTVIAECNFDTCAYVARYIMKKQTGSQSDFYRLHDLTPEFTRMSRMPGIGRTFYDENTSKIYSADRITLLGADGKAITPAPPKYFDKLYADAEPEAFESIKEARKEKQAVQERSRELLTGISKSSQIHIEQRARDRAIISLKRIN